MISHYFDICFLGRPGYKQYQVKLIREQKKNQFRFHPLYQSKTTLALIMIPQLMSQPWDHIIGKAALYQGHSGKLLRDRANRNPSLKGNVFCHSGAAGCNKKWHQEMWILCDVGKSLNLSGPQFHHAQNEEIGPDYLQGPFPVWRLVLLFNPTLVL